MKRQRGVISGLGQLALAGGLLCLGPSDAAPVASPAQTPYFSEVSTETGIDFRHFNGMSGEYYLAEIMGSGAAVFDYDNDGDLDVYLVQGAMLGPGKRLSDALFPPQADTPLTDRLLRNNLQVGEDGMPRLNFTDITAESGIRTVAYGMGVATGDFDNDGWVDLYITNFGTNQLLRNNGDGTFVDVTEQAKVGDPRWSVSAAFLDYNRDGWLDIFVGNYVRLGLERFKPCRAPSSALDYCTPLAYEAQPDRLYRNRGDGSFEDVSERAGITRDYGAALGVAVADFDGDGWPDVYVANDATANQLWTNQKDGTFRNNALFAGVAVNMQGAPEGSMGVDAADYDGDGDVDLFMTHITRETNTIYVNDGQGWFEDRTIAIGLAAPSKGYTGFGTGWFDLDNDGWLDLFAGNGEVSIIDGLSNAADPFPLHQPNQLFLNDAGRRFLDVSDRGGPALALSEVTRGAAFGDVDNDGDIDIVVTNNNGPARLLLNDKGNQASWLGLRLLDRHGRGQSLVAPGKDRRQLCLGERCPGAGGAWQDPAGPPCSCSLAGRICGGMEGPAGERVHHPAAGHGRKESVRNRRAHWSEISPASVPADALTQGGSLARLGLSPVACPKHQTTTGSPTEPEWRPS